ncbi:hypothetical protein ACWD26_08020 [Streptomyces sp. NPDC002787]
MQSESAKENLTREPVYEIASAPAAEGPVFVDNSGRRARLLRRCGMLLGASVSVTPSYSAWR